MTERQAMVLMEAHKYERTYLADQPLGRSSAAIWWRACDRLRDAGLLTKLSGVSAFQITPEGHMKAKEIASAEAGR